MTARDVQAIATEAEEWIAANQKVQKWADYEPVIRSFLDADLKFRHLWEFLETEKGFSPESKRGIEGAFYQIKKRYDEENK